MAEICARIKENGFAETQVIRIYGEEFEILSDPFPSDTGVAIQVRSRRTSQVRALQLPASMIHRAQDTPRRLA